MEKQTVYLAGPIHNASDPSRWREDIIGATNTGQVEYINPLDLEVDLDDPEDIVMTDLKQIKDSDVMIIHHEPGTEHWGTPIEGWMAQVSYDTYVITWLDEFDQDKEEVSPWLEYITDKFVRTGRDAINKAIRA